MVVEEEVKYRHLVTEELTALSPPTQPADCDTPMFGSTMDSWIGDYMSSPPFPVDFNSFFAVTSEKMLQRRKRRRKLLQIRMFSSKFLFIVALCSIIIMMINVQLTLLEVFTVCSQTAIILKITVSVLTGILLGLVWMYNYIQLELFRNIRNIDSFRIAAQVNPFRGFLLLLETVVSLPHPLPICMGLGAPPVEVISPEANPFTKDYSDGFELLVNNETAYYNATATGYSVEGRNLTNTYNNHENIVRLNDIDSVLSILMFLRLYHIARFTVLHSKLFRTMLSYSLGALAHTKYNFSFIFKSYMAIYKGYFLAGLALTFSGLAAWCIYICDREIVQYLDALWVVGITFFTVGYGDMYPVSRCSQLISVLTGFSGMFFMGISVTILSRYLQLTYDEYCMLTFFIEADLQKKRQQASAMIIKAAWFQYRHRNSPDTILRLKTQRNLIKALHFKKNIEYQKISGRERREKQVPLYDMKEQMKKLSIRTEHVLKRESHLEEDVDFMNAQLQVMEEKLLTLLKLIQKGKREPRK